MKLRKTSIIGAALLAPAILLASPAQAQWGCRGSCFGYWPGHYGHNYGYNYGYNHHHGGAPVWPYVLGGIAALGGALAFAAPYYAPPPPPPVVYAQPPVVYAPPPGYYGRPW